MVHCVMHHSGCAWADAVNRIALVKPDKSKGVENMVLQMAQRGQLNEKVSSTCHVDDLAACEIPAHLL